MTTSLTCEDVYATGLDCQEMFVLWFLSRTKVVSYEMFLYKVEVVDVSKSQSKCHRIWSYILIGSVWGKPSRLLVIIVDPFP